MFDHSTTLWMKGLKDAWFEVVVNGDKLLLECFCSIVLRNYVQVFFQTCTDFSNQI